MLAFLSPEWIDALGAAAAADLALAEATVALSLVVEQEVADGPDGGVVFHIRFDHGRVAVASGPADVDGDDPPPVVRFSQGYATAWAIAQGTESAQRAFMAGALQVGGDLRVLLDHQATLAALHDVFAVVRAQTVAGPGPEAGRADVVAG